MSNRILSAVSAMKVRVDSKVLSADKLTALNASLDMEFGEYCRFQELKSAMVGSVLTLDEANTLYGYLGNTPSVFNAQPIHVKAVCTQVFGELLKRGM